MKAMTLIFLILAIFSLTLCMGVRIAENEWYQNITGQCGINDNGTCDGWQSSVLIISISSFIVLMWLFCISNHLDKKDALSIKEVKKDE